MDNDYKEKLEMEEHVLVPQGVYVSREDLETFGFSARRRGCFVSAQGNDETGAHGKLLKADGRGVEEHIESRGSTKTRE